MRHVGLSWFLAIALCTLMGARAPQDLSLYAPGYRGIVLTAVPMTRAEVINPSARSLPRKPYGESGRLMLLASDGTTRTLTPGFASAADPAVSFDGKRILFAAKRNASDSWNIFEMAADGSGIHQVTRNLGNCRSPMYQSALFYLNDARPSYQITFVSDAAKEFDESAPSEALNLYSVRFDGSSLRRLTYGVSSSYDPYQMQDGRILFSNWNDRIGLSAVHLDGTDYTTFSGTQGRRVMHMACTTSKGMVVFIESDTPPADGAGNIAVLSLRRSLHSYKRVTTPAEGVYYAPSPLPDGSILVSQRPATGGTYAIYRLDLASGSRVPVYRLPGEHCIQAVVLAERPEPDGHSSVVEDDQGWSKLYALNVYESDLKRGWLQPGGAKRIRVIEGLPRSLSTGDDSLSAMIQKRLLGELDLDEDGSFHVSVPPNTPIQMQLIDGDGIALRTSGWIWTKNKENRGCIGCHEDAERTPENMFAKALSHPAAELTLPSAARRTVDFQRDIQPILTAKCANHSCHGGSAAPNLSAGTQSSATAFTPSYRSLLVEASTSVPGRGKYVDPGRARTSPLVSALAGKNTARPWDGLAPPRIVKHMPPAGSSPLTDDERRSLFEWIDLGAQFHTLPSGGKR